MGRSDRNFNLDNHLSWPWDSIMVVTIGWSSSFERSTSIFRSCFRNQGYWGLWDDITLHCQWQPADFPTLGNAAFVVRDSEQRPLRFCNGKAKKFQIPSALRREGFKEALLESFGREITHDKTAYTTKRGPSEKYRTPFQPWSGPTQIWDGPSQFWNGPLKLELRRINAEIFPFKH